MKQTFVQKFRSGDIDQPITREHIANALNRMAEQLRLPEQPDYNQDHWPLQPNHSFEIEGHGELSDGCGQIKLTVRAPRCA